MGKTFRRATNGRGWDDDYDLTSRGEVKKWRKQNKHKRAERHRHEDQFDLNDRVNDDSEAKKVST